jgi:hypothetical protein
MPLIDRRSGCLLPALLYMIGANPKSAITKTDSAMTTKDNFFASS